MRLHFGMIHNSFLDHCSPAYQCTVPEPFCPSARTCDHSASCCPASFLLSSGPGIAYRNQCTTGPHSSWRFAGPSLHGKAVKVHRDGCAKLCAHRTNCVGRSSLL